MLLSYELTRVAAGLTWKRERMRQAITPETFATDRAVELAQSGMPFRDAYRQVASEIAQLAAGDPDASLAARTSPGACADLRLDAIRARLTS